MEEFAMRSRAHLGSHPIHPMLIPFPFALWTASLIFDVLGVMFDRALLWSVGYYCAIGGSIGALLAAVPGIIDWYSVVPPNSSGKKRGAVHGTLNVTVLLIFTYIIFHRGDALAQPDRASLIASFIAVAILSYSGWLGGTLSYRNQIGVDHRYANAGKWRERDIAGWDKPVCNTGELSEGQMMLAHIAGERIVVGRCQTGLVAFSDHCTHRGGPLSDGALVGCTVQCPWHGSNFDVHSGRVVAGPAEEKIKTYQIEIRANEVYVLPEPARERKIA
jgi:uncharacterized membrane protein/nitrite reductase/ring-hydroxylating ferredoxin subunit